MDWVETSRERGDDVEAEISGQPAIDRNKKKRLLSTTRYLTLYGPMGLHRLLHPECCLADHSLRVKLRPRQD